MIAGPANTRAVLVLRHALTARLVSSQQTLVPVRVCVLIHAGVVIRQILHSYFTRTFLAVCMCECRLTGLLETVQQSERLETEHGRAASAAPLEEAAAGVCVLMHVGVA